MNKLQKLLNALPTTDVNMSEAFAMFDEEVQKLKRDLKQNIEVDTLEEVNDKLKEFKKQVDVTPIESALEELRSVLVSQILSLQGDVETKSKELTQLTKQSTSNLTESTKQDIQLIKADIKIFEKRITDLIQNSISAVRNLNDQFLKNVQTNSELITDKLIPITARLDKTDQLVGDNKSLSDANKEELEKAIEQLKLRIQNIGGGNQNRQIYIGGNDPLTKYTDINLKAGSNVTLTYTNNETTKKVDVTVAATGGSGSTRSITSIAVDTTAGDTAGTDYVYICTAALTLTLPTAIGNTNLYTIKNTSSGIINIVTTAGQTIDSNANIQLATQYTSVDLISDSANWSIT